MPVVDVKTENNIFIKLNTVISIQSKERRCNIIAENNRVIINKIYIKEFSTLENSRMKIILKDDSNYFISRYYLKNLRRYYYD